MNTVEINTLPDGNSIKVGPERPLLLLAGPCVLESGEMGL
jgi:3-deoxy-D-manno-octulosonic acid (KDO) 8-phosphate synthase